MLSTSFDFNVTSTRVVAFTVPATVTPGSNCQFNITITHDGVLLGILWFVKVVPANRVITFSVGPSIPLGVQHFTVLITILSRAAAAATTAARTTSAADDEPAQAMDATTHEQTGGDGTMTDNVANPA